MTSPPLDSPVSDPGVRDAVRVLRDYGITPEQYATIDLTEYWRVGGVEYPNRDAVFAAARENANCTGSWVEVWLEIGQDRDVAESWIVEPDDRARNADQLAAVLLGDARDAS